MPEGRKGLASKQLTFISVTHFLQFFCGRSREFSNVKIVAEAAVATAGTFILQARTCAFLERCDRVIGRLGVSQSWPLSPARPLTSGIILFLTTAIRRTEGLTRCACQNALSETFSTHRKFESRFLSGARGEESPLARNSFQLVHPALLKIDCGTRHEVLHGPGDKHAARLGFRHDARTRVDCDASDIVAH